MSLSYLLLDFGGRSGTIGAARENTIAVDLDYNATLQNVVLQSENAYFAYISSRALVRAQLQTVAEADTNLIAAQVRHNSGVATIADVLQAQTVLAQAQLDLETDSGTVRTNHGNLATAMGLRADATFEVEMPSDTMSIGSASASADSLIVSALDNRPDLAAARVNILQAQQEVRVARSNRIPGDHGRRQRRTQLLESLELHRQQLRAHPRPLDSDLQRPRAPVRSRGRQVAGG